MVSIHSNPVRHATLGGGVTLPYVEQGNPDGAPMLLLHGYTDSWRSFRLLLDCLPPSLHAIAPTQRGHGDASRPLAGYAMADFAADAAGLLDALGIDAAVIVGHSMGSAVAQRFALDFPARTRGLVLIGAAASWANPAVAELAEEVAAMDDPIDPEFVRAFQASTVASATPPGFIDEMTAVSLMAPAHVWKAVLHGLMKADLAPRLGRIAAPTLLAWGDQDAFVGADEQKRLAAAMPHATRLVYAGVGHSPHWEKPERMAADLTRFVQGLPI